MVSWRKSIAEYLSGLADNTDTRPLGIGPKFRADDLMQLLRTANLPTPHAGPGDSRRSRSPPPRGTYRMSVRWSDDVTDVARLSHPTGGRPPPDYGPYQGPGGGRGGRRY